jgi:predicted ATP-grasp superfamily ATP-dependent carboligase
MAIIGERLNRPTIVIPTDDFGAIFLAEHAATLHRWFLFPQPPATMPRTLANKRELYRLCRRIGVPCPETVFPSSIAEVREFVKHAAFPVMVKVAESWRRPEGAPTTSIARTPDQLYAIYQTSEGPGGPNLIFQEYIAPGEDWFYQGYWNGRPDSGAGFTGRKLRSYPPFTGPATLGKAVANSALRQQAEALLQAISYSGIMDLDYRLDKRDGRYKLVDFNPRIGAQFRLFEDGAGVDVARALYLDLTGRCVPRSAPLNGRTFVVEFHDLAASLGYFRQGALTFQKWRRSFRGTREWAWSCRDDPLPFLVMCIRLLLRAVEKILRLRPKPDIGDCMPRYVGSLRDWVRLRTPEAL